MVHHGRRRGPAFHPDRAERPEGTRAGLAAFLFDRDQPAGRILRPGSRSYGPEGMAAIARLLFEGWRSRMRKPPAGGG